MFSISQDTNAGVVNSTLLLDNNRQQPPIETIDGYEDFVLDTSRTWLLDDDNEDGIVEVTNVQANHVAHVAAHSNVKRYGKP